DTKADADGDGAAEEGLHLARAGTGGDVVIVRLAPQNLVADAPAGPQGLEAGLPQAADDVGGEGAVGHGRDCGAAGRAWQGAAAVGILMAHPTDAEGRP